MSFEQWMLEISPILTVETVGDMREILKAVWEAGYQEGWVSAQEDYMYGSKK